MKIIFLVVLSTQFVLAQPGGPPGKSESLVRPGDDTPLLDQKPVATPPSDFAGAENGLREVERNVPNRSFAELDKISAVAEMKPTEGNLVTGFLSFVQTSRGTRVIGRISGLKPNSIHGLHIHEFGDCSAPDARSAGGHFNPNNQIHGALGKTLRAHMGDLGNLAANERGVGSIQRTFLEFTVNRGTHQVLGRSVVVHERADDLRTQPSGNSGRPVACGVITKMSHPDTDVISAPTESE